MTFDDRFYFSYRVAGSIPVLRIAPSSGQLLEEGDKDPIASVFKEDPLFRYRSSRIDRIDHSSLNEEHLILLDRVRKVPSGLLQELKKFMENGGDLGLIPRMGVPPAAYNPLFQSLGMEPIASVDSTEVSIHSINNAHHFYRNVFQKIPDNIDLPKARFYYRFKDDVRSQREDLMSFRNGSPFFFMHPYQKGRLYFFSSPPGPGGSDMIGHALYPTTLLRMAELSQPSNEAYRTIGDQQGIEMRGLKQEGDAPIRIEAKEGGLSLIPEQKRYGGVTRLHLRGRIEQAGHYDIVYKDRPIRGLGINYSRKESRLDHFSPEAFQSELDAVGEGYRSIERKVHRNKAGIGTISEGIGLWWYCIIFALAFFGLETLILAFPKTLGLER